MVGGIDIGNNVLFGPRVGIYTSNHSANVIAAGVQCKVIREITEEDRTGFEV